MKLFTFLCRFLLLNYVHLTLNVRSFAVRHYLPSTISKRNKTRVHIICTYVSKSTDLSMYVNDEHIPYPACFTLITYWKCKSLMFVCWLVGQSDGLLVRRSVCHNFRKRQANCFRTEITQILHITN